MHRRDLLAGTEEFAGTSGNVGEVGRLLEHGTDERLPLFATFVTHPQLGGDVVVDEESLQKIWGEAFDGKPPCPLIVLMGGEIKLHYKEPPAATSETLGDGHRIANIHCPLYGIPAGTVRFKEKGDGAASDIPEYEVDWTKCKCGGSR